MTIPSSLKKTVIRPVVLHGRYYAVRCFGSGGGSRGSRGHGWWVNYRGGKGGRHLQGEYNHLDFGSLAQWNDAVFSLGSRRASLEISVEQIHHSTKDVVADGQTDNHVLTFELASAVLPDAVQNFINLLEATEGGFKGSFLHRVEKTVGIQGGLVWNETGRCHEAFRMPTSLSSMRQTEHMILSHIPGTLTMLSPRVREIDSRFMFCSNNAPHLDGHALAIGRLDEESLEKVRHWESTLITRNGRPTSVALKVVGCNVEN
jgi:cyclophilin family peptidyl-prolyl cis-trans isomerase